MHWVKCSKCGKTDKGRHDGTSTKMRCPDCAGPDGRATQCRDCCPTGHQTRWMKETEYYCAFKDEYATTPCGHPECIAYREGKKGT